MCPATVRSYDDVVENVRSFNLALEDTAGEAAARLRARLGRFWVWYYVPELDQVGPARFIGYAGMTAARYAAREGLRGGRAVAALSRWFREASPRSTGRPYIAGMVARLLERHDSALNAQARYNHPIGWQVGSRESRFSHPGIAEEPAAYPVVERPPSKIVQAIIRRGDEQFVAECVDLAVVTQGHTLDEVAENLREAVALHMEGEDLTALGLVPDPAIVVTMELGPTGA